jgi:predicted nucleic acid-binding protein
MLWDNFFILALGSVPVTGTIGILILAVVEQLCTLAEADVLLETMISLGYYAPINRFDSILPE